MTGLTDREIVERLRSESSALFLPVALSAAEAIERLIETTDTQDLFLGEFELGFRDLEHQVERLTQERDEAVEALRETVFIVDKAGLSNLVNGVQLGPTSWYVKATERFDYARSILSKYETEAKP